jgi:5'-phosphate synthase pdxT subunit
MARVGVLALQGGFAAHVAALADIGLEPVEVRDAAALAGVDGLVLPGGESTTLLKLIERFELGPALAALHARGVPIMGTCAGLILLAREVWPSQPSLGWLDVVVERNAYGRQRDSFEALDDSGALRLTFIRAPRIRRVGAAEILATHQGEPVLVAQGNVVGAAFHPELTADRRVHQMVFGDPRLGRSPSMGQYWLSVAM